MLRRPCKISRNSKTKEEIAKWSLVTWNKSLTPPESRGPRRPLLTGSNLSTNWRRLIYPRLSLNQSWTQTPHEDLKKVRNRPSWAWETEGKIEGLLNRSSLTNQWMQWTRSLEAMNPEIWSRWVRARARCFGVGCSQLQMDDRRRMEDGSCRRQSGLGWSRSSCNQILFWILPE